MPDRDGQPALPSRPASSTSQPASKKKKLRPSGGRGPRLRRIPGDTYVRVRACTCVYVRVRMCTCAYVRVHMCTFVYVRVHSCTYVYVRLQRCTYVYVGVPGNSTQAGARDPSPSQGSFFFFLLAGTVAVATLVWGGPWSTPRPGSQGTGPWITRVQCTVPSPVTLAFGASKCTTVVDLGGFSIRPPLEGICIGSPTCRSLC